MYNTTPQLSSFKKWVLGAGIFNTVVAFPFSLPFFYKYCFALLNYLNASFNLGGSLLVPPTEGVNSLFINTAGLALCLVGLILIYASTNLENMIRIPFLNAIARVIFSGLLLYYVVAKDIARVLTAFAVIDLIIAGAFMHYYLVLDKRTQKQVMAP